MTDEQINGYYPERLYILLKQDPDRDPSSPITADSLKRVTGLALDFALSPEYPEVELEYLPDVFSWLRKEKGEEEVLIAGMPAGEYVKKVGAAIFAPVKIDTSNSGETSKKAPVSPAPSRKIATARVTPSRSHARLDSGESTLPIELVASLQLSQQRKTNGYEEQVAVFADVEEIIGALQYRGDIDRRSANRLLAITSTRELRTNNSAHNNSYRYQEAIAGIRSEFSTLKRQKDANDKKYPSEWGTGSTLFMSYLDYAANTKYATLTRYMQTITKAFDEHKLEVDTQYLLSCIGYSIAVAYRSTRDR